MAAWLPLDSMYVRQGYTYIAVRNVLKVIEFALQVNMISCMNIIKYVDIQLRCCETKHNEIAVISINYITHLSHKYYTSFT